MPLPLDGGEALILDVPFLGRARTIMRIQEVLATVACDIFERETPDDVDLGNVASPPFFGMTGGGEPRRSQPFAGSSGRSEPAP